MQKDVDFNGVFAEGCGELGDFEGAEQVDSCISKNAHRGVSGAAADAREVFFEDHIAHPEEAVLDIPATTPQLKQSVRIDLVPRQTGHGIGDGAFGFSVNCGCSFQPQELFDAGPAAGVDANRCGCQFADFKATTFLRFGLGCFTRRIRFLLGVGGKSLRGQRRLGGLACVSSVGCL